jgi:DNA-binding Xre family transcriptional regulator
MISLQTYYRQTLIRAILQGMKVRVRLKEVADERGMSMTKISHRSEVAYGTIRRLVRDPYAEVTLSTLRRIAGALGCATCELIEDVPDDRAD